MTNTKKQNKCRGLYGEARRVLETWAKLGTGQKDNREDESRDHWKRVRVRIPKLRRSLQKSEGSSVREFGRHREHPHSLNRCSGHVGGAHVHLGETVAESHHVAKTNFNLYGYFKSIQAFDWRIHPIGWRWRAVEQSSGSSRVVELGDSDSDTRDLMTGLFLDALRCAALPLRLRVPKSSS